MKFTLSINVFLYLINYLICTDFEVFKVNNHFRNAQRYDKERPINFVLYSNGHYKVKTGLNESQNQLSFSSFLISKIFTIRNILHA